MKKLINLIVICLFAFSANAFEKNLVNSEIRKNINIEYFSKSRVILETGFGSSIFIQDNAHEELMGKEIMKVSLVYTTYREVSDFDQINLNEKRWDNLFKLIPDLQKDEGIAFNEIGVDKCKIQKCAENQLHGFIVEYKKEAFNYTNLEIQSINIQCDQVSEIIGDQGTKIKIPSHAFVDINGKEITGKVEIGLREALSAEDIAIAKLLTITDDFQPLESGGMIEINAWSNGRQLQLKEGKLISVSIPKKKNVPDMKVWEGEWKNGQLQWVKPQPLEGNNPLPLTVDIRKPEAEEISLVFDERLGIVEDIRQDSLPSVSISQGEQPKGDCVQVSNVQFSVTNDLLESVCLTTPGLIIEFLNNDYSFEIGKEKGLSDYQATKVMRWFENEKIPNDIPFQFWGWSRVTTNDWNVPLVSESSFVTNSGANTNVIGYGTTATQYAFTSRKLGWANIDRLAKLRAAKTAKMELACLNGSSVEDLSASMMIPKRNIYLPGYKLENGNYCFIPVGWENSYSLPRGERAVVIVTGKKGDQVFSSIKKVVLGENEIEETKLVPMTKNETVNELKKVI